MAKTKETTKTKAKTKTKIKKKTGRPSEWDDERIQKEAADIIAWSEQDDALVLEKFSLYRSPPYVRSVLYKLAEKSDIFRDALLIAKERVRSRREEGAVIGTFNASVMQFTHAFYDRDRNATDQSFTAHKKEMKVVEKQAESTVIAQAIIESKKFIEEAKADLEKEEKA